MPDPSEFVEVLYEPLCSLCFDGFGAASQRVTICSPKTMSYRGFDINQAAADVGMAEMPHDGTDRFLFLAGEGQQGPVARISTEGVETGMRRKEEGGGEEVRSSPT